MQGRELNKKEKFLLYSILPANRKGYNEYRQKISEMVVVNEEEIYEGKLLLSKSGEYYSSEPESTPSFAMGYSAYDGRKYYIVIHEEREGFIQALISREGEAKGEGLLWSYSNWRPGLKAPGDNSKVREVHLLKNKLVVAVAPAHKRIWVYEADSGVNYILPVTNFYNEIMKAKEERNPRVVLNPQRIFEHPEELSDKEIGQGFLLYNEYLNRIEINYDLFKSKSDGGRKIFFKKIFGKQNV